jgi:hypothetical protein
MSIDTHDRHRRQLQYGHPKIHTRKILSLEISANSLDFMFFCKWIIYLQISTYKEKLISKIYFILKLFKIICADSKYLR